MKTPLALLTVILLAATMAFGQWPLPGCPAPTMNKGGTPDYMSGCVGNYANSPLPAVSGGVTGLTLLNGGAGYSLAPTVTIDPPAGGGTQATATAAVSNGVITSFTIVTPGSGYTSVPNVTITDPSGMDALATAVVPVVAGTGMRKFVDGLPGLGSGNINNLGQYLPLAVPDTISYPGSDYYEISLIEYQQRMHSDLQPTTLRGYVQTNNGTDGNGQNTVTPAPVQYLGPVIVAQKDRPIRVKFTNALPTGTGGNLSVPVDTSVMGAGMGPDGSSLYTQNRATLHLHGGNTPWISDGTPHQWTVPDQEATPFLKGVSVRDVPDMPATVAGQLTFYYTNQQSARLMFYHDHTYGITRLNVYAGEAAAYLLQDPIEDALVNGGTITVPGTGSVNVSAATIPADQIPLVIQDKSFVPSAAQLAAQDPTWNWGPLDINSNFIVGSLWFPHVYMPNQDPYANDNSGANPMGRWDYGLWFWPPMDPASLTGPGAGEVACPTGANPNQKCPGIPNPSIVPEAFLDTPVVNGTAYPYLMVQPKPYRLRILNAANDRAFNLQLYQAFDAATGQLCPGLPSLPSSGQTQPSTCTEVKLIPSTAGIAGQGPIPDPATKGPQMIQIGTEGGFLPAPVVLDNTPIGYNYNRRDIVVLNVESKNLFLGPAERADVIVDFSVFAGKTLIFYNDAPAPVPAFDTRYDYYTGAPDQTDTGGAPTIQPGYGPNTRTLMQIQVAACASTCGSFNAAPLNLALPAAFAASQPAPIVPEAAYGSVYGQTYPNTYSTIQSTTLTYTPVDTSGVPTGTPVTRPILRKAIQELFEVQYGRMNATLGVELPFTNFNTQTTIPLGYIDPATEIVGDGETQLWKVTHNGVDTHAIHFHLFNVQLINRVGWDGAIRPPDANELGWKETVRMNPLEDAIVALQPIKPTLPGTWPDLPSSVRPVDVTTSAANVTVTNPVDGNPITVPNSYNFGWEYVWHCHLLGHEENDMMRPIVFNRVLQPTVGAIVSPAPNLAGWNNTSPVTVTITGTPYTLGPPISSITYSASGATTIAPTTVATNPATVNISAQGTTILTYYATDTGAASSAVATVTVKLDTVNPTLTWGVATPAPNGFGWNKTAVTFPWTASDATSGVATPGATGSLIVSTQGTSQTGTVTVTDVAGNSQTFTSPAVNIDLTTPVVSAVANPATAKIGKGTINVTVSGTVTDALSGVNRPSGTYRISPGTTTGTFTIGATGAYSFKISIPGKTATTYTITVGASDLAGNLGTATTTVTVR